MTPDWITLRQGKAPLLVSLPHTGTEIPPAFMAGLVSPWLARKDCDWWIEKLYDFAADLDATIVRTTISRTVIDVNRDPSGVSLYPGQATTELCPTTTFDGEPLYLDGHAPDAAAIAHRRKTYFDPYHATLAAELARLRELHPRVVLYDCHSIRSVIPRLFDGELPLLNLGTNSGASCDPYLTKQIESFFKTVGGQAVTDGRFKGGYITRHFGMPEKGIHAVQMELSCRFYMQEPSGPVSQSNWPAPYDPRVAGYAREVLFFILKSCLHFAKNGPEAP